MAYHLTVKELKHILNKYKDDTKILVGIQSSDEEEFIQLTTHEGIEYRVEEDGRMYSSKSDISGDDLSKAEEVLIIWAD